MAAPTTTDIGMKYRFLGDSGLLVSALSFGCMNFAMVKNSDNAYELLKHAYKHGVNYWDTSENYLNSENVVGEVLQRGIQENEWTREDLVISTKIYGGTKEGPNAKGLSRKHIIEGTKASLKRLQTDYVDVIFCHRIEKYTPMEEIVRAMNFVISQGWAFYWSTSAWHEADVLEACEIADRLGLARPIADQAQYNLFVRSQVEVDYQSLYKKYKYGLTTWSPLANGLLTGKYAAGVPEGTRLSNAFFASLVGDINDRVAQVEKLRPIAEELGCSLVQLAVAWTVSNEHVSTVLIGASSLKQLDENLKAFPLVAKITPEIKQRIDEIIPFKYEPPSRDFFYAVREKYLQQ